MRVWLLVFVLLLFVVPAGNVQAVVPQQGLVDDFHNSDDLIAELTSESHRDPALMQSVAYRPHPAKQQELLNLWLEADDKKIREPQAVIGMDDRIQLSPTAAEVAYLFIGFGNGSVYMDCTGTFIGPNVILTAAHCVHDQDVGGFADGVVVVPGKNGAVDPFGSVFTANIVVPVGWVEGNQESIDISFFDFALVILDEDLGAQTGWLSVGVLPDDTLNDPEFYPFTVGYPGDKEYGTQWFSGAQAFSAVFDDYLINHIDQMPGQSGSAMMRGADGAIVGVVSFEHAPNGVFENVARRITPDVLNFMLDVCTDFGCSFSHFTESEPPVSEPPPTQPPAPPAPNPPPPVTTPPSSSTAFQNTWARTDQPVAQGQANRTWMWGPTAFSSELYEPYAETPGGQRTVQYFDKSRMEVTNPTGDPNSIWYVTNGLLVNELMTGKLQLGNDTFKQHRPAQVNVAGDADDASGPTYATFAALLGAAPLAEGSVVTQRVDRAGTVNFDPSFAGENVTAARFVPETNHTVASVFWDFMNSEGLVFDSGANVWAPLFVNPFYATGYPVTEAYWASVKVGGTYRNVLIQVFERRVLTYTPGNGPGWEVEAGNVGQHYYTWRYEQIPSE